MGNLKVTTPSDREIAMTRVFDAPRRLVFDAYTKPELLKRWLGVFGGWSLVVCEIDLRVGGTYRYVWRNSDGSEMGMRGVYREVVPPERIVSTESFDEPWYEGEAVGTVAFAEQGGKTTLTMTLRYASQAVRDAVLKSPMQSGVAQSFDDLAKLLTNPRRLGRSVAAVVSALLAVFVLSLGTDQILHMLQVYPPWGQRMSDPLFLLATSYRIVFNVAGGYIAARLAPYAPLRHALALGVVGLVLSGAGAIVAIAKPELGPVWYPIALVVLAVPCAWLGGRIAERSVTRRTA